MYLVKKTFEYIGLLVLVVFSFYYTDKAVKMVNKNDPLMEQIVKYASVNNSSCVEGYSTDEGVVLGVSGLVVDEYTSYSNMKGFGYNEDLFAFEEDACSINKAEYVDKYIIRGNESKNAVSLLILVDDVDFISSINDIALSKGVNLNYIVDGEILQDNKSLFYDLANNGNTILYGGNNKEDFNDFHKVIDDFKTDTFCIYNDYDVIGICKDKGVNSVKTDFIYNKNFLLNIKNTLEKGNIYILKGNKYVTSELSSIISHINGKGIDIVSLQELLQ